ncbi:MAG: serine/threonine-protein kinase [Caldimonas sp.]
MELRDLKGDWPALDALLDEALALPASERSAWLASLSGERATLRETLARLLETATGVETDEVLDVLPRFGAPADEADDPLAEPAPGDAVGPYRLLSELGRGGMGAVWLAERADAQPRRRIALKLPHIGWAPGLAARLARERDILASLAHPNIARLYDAGVDQIGRPYLALEFVDGVPIDRYCESHALPLRARLDLVLQVAAAVGHAHTRLVVHRDLKPSNILVTADGEVRLLDFGIAKLVQHEDGGEATELTRIAGRALTPDYASPEQIRGEPIGTASDVYSLGVVSYELLAGARPYRLKGGTGANGLADAIAHAEAPLASRFATDPTLKRQLAGDLDAILNKALKKDPAERYATVAAFAEDIERHLRHAPVSARPDRIGYRARKFAVRHALQVAAGALVLAALLVGSGVALWQARQARFEAARAEQVKDFALSIFADADTDSGAGAATTAADLLKAAKTRVESEFPDRPEVAVELMTAVGYALLGQARPTEAGELMQRTVRRGRAELGDRHPLTLAAIAVQGEALVALSQPQEAIDLLTPALAETRRQGLAHVLVNGLATLAAAQVDVDDVDAAVKSAQASVDALPPGSGAVDKLDAVIAWSSLAHALHAGRRTGQIDAARHAVAAAKSLYGDRVAEPLLAARLYLAKGRITEGQDPSALDELSAVLADEVRLLGPGHPRVEVAANFVGQARLEAGDAAGAVEAFRTQLAATELVKRRNPMDLGMGHFAVAAALAAAHRYDEALPHYVTSARLVREAGGDDAPLALRALSSRALALARLGRIDEAEREFAALNGAKWAGLEIAGQASRLAVLRSLQGRHDEAIELARSATQGVSAHPSKYVRASVARTLGSVLLAAGRVDEAIAPLQAAVSLYAESQIVISPDRADAIAALARAQAATAMPDSPKPKS